MKTYKLFISQPMVDKTDKEIELARTRAINTALNQVKRLYNESNAQIEIIDSFIKDAPHDAKPVWYLAKSIEFLSDANIIFFAKGWNEYRGCKIENTIAHEYLEQEGAIIIEE
jgi:hypothetical protein